MADTDRIKRNLSKMIDQGAPEADLNAYLGTEGFKSPDEWNAAIAPQAASRGPAPKPVAAAMSVNNPPPQAGPAAAPQEQPPALPWSDLPGNIPQSALGVANALVQPILHPIDTAQGVGTVLRGMESPKTMGKVTLPNGQTVFQPQSVPETAGETAARTAPADAAGKFFADRFGSMRRIRNSLISDPVGMAADAATVLTGGALLPGRAGAVAGKVASIVDPIAQTGNALKLAGRGAEALTSNALGMTTGRDARSVRTAAQAGRESVTGGQAGAENATVLRENMRGAPVENVVDRAKGGLDKIIKEAGAEYRSGMIDISKDRTVLDFGDINKAVDNAGNVGKFKGANIAPTANDINDRLRTVVREWETLDPKSPLFKDVAPGELTAANFHTPEGLDALKRTIGDIRDSTQPRTPERVAANRVYSAVRAEIVAQAPAYGKIMEAYEKAADKIGEASRTLSIGEKATGDTAARKLLSATRNNVQTNFGGRQKLIDMLAEKDPTLPYAIAGQGMNALAPGGVVARGGLMGSMIANPMNALAAPAFSPRVVGEGAYYAGKGAGLAERGANALRITEENLRRAGRGSYQAGRVQEAR